MPYLFCTTCILFIALPIGCWSKGYFSTLHQGFTWSLEAWWAISLDKAEVQYTLIKQLLKEQNPQTSKFEMDTYQRHSPPPLFNSLKSPPFMFLGKPLCSVDTQCAPDG